MKKTLTLMALLILAFSLSACGDGSGGNQPAGSEPNNESATTTSPEQNTADKTAEDPSSLFPDLSAAIGGADKLAGYDAEAQQALIAAAREAGGDMEFHSDGTVVFMDDGGNVTTQKPDGTWEYQSVDGESGSVQFGGEWPDNEFTRQLPKPDFTLSTAITSDDGFTVIFIGATLDQIKAYAEQVKSVGFTVDENIEDREMSGMVFYTYTAQNTDGYEITVFSADSSAGLTMTK